jgi:N-acetylated-alpha-linked acidic dipeptidase
MRFVLALAIVSLATPAAADQAGLEKQFDALISPQEMGGWLKVMAAEPNHVGSPHDKANAEYELGLFRQWGWDARLETFQVMYPTPISESLDLVGPSPFYATLQEPPIQGDSSATHQQPALPAYVAYQGDGDVQAGLVYVNYGMPDDYEQLARLGVDVRGRVVIARYGSGWRGLKPRLAQEHGAIGCIIYSDPSDDGYAVDRVYPDGPMRPPHGVQRGSVSDMTLYPGDPTTPDTAPAEGAKHLAREDAPAIMKIPVLPISYADAQVFLQALGGPLAPASWRGALPITYHVGPGSAEVHMAVHSDWRLREIYDVIAVMQGTDQPDQWVVRGNHHDGWVFGASDPLSGQIALMAEAKAIGAMVKDGYKPKRTLVYASWDAEEPMLIGSTAWAQAHYDELRQKAVIYINSDTNSRGVFYAEGSADWQHLVGQVADGLQDPETHASVAARQKAKLRVDALSPDAEPNDVADAKLVAAGGDVPLQPMGSGSDYSPFINHLGLPALNLGYYGEGQVSGIYHSLYDTYEHHSRWVDPGFVYDALLAKTAGHTVLRVAEADLPPERAGDFAAAVGRYLDAVKKRADHKREESEQRAALLKAGAFQLADDPTRPTLPPPALDTVPFFDFAPLENAVRRLAASAKAYDQAVADHGAKLSAGQRDKLWALMQTIDQTLAPENVGLPGRPWYRNLVYAPGRMTGYGAKPLPGVLEAVEDRRWADVDQYARLTADALNAYSDRLDEAVGVAQGRA